MSAGSYSKNAAAGNKGKCITDTNTIEIAASIAIPTICLVDIFCFTFCCGDVSFVAEKIDLMFSIIKFPPFVVV